MEARDVAAAAATAGRGALLLKVGALVAAFGLAALIILGAVTAANTAQENALTCSANAPGADSTIPQPTGDADAELNLTLATWNTLRSNSVKRTVAGIKALRTDVIALQELSGPGRRRQVIAQMAPVYRASSNNNAVKILWRRDKYDLVAQDSVEVFGVRRIENGTAGTSIGPKSVHWVQLRDRSTGADVIIVNHHLVPDVDRKGHPRPGAKRRLRAYHDQMTAMLALVDRLKTVAPVVVTADWNVDARRDAKVKDPRFPYVLLQKHGLYSNWRALGYPAKGTQSRGKRLIDMVASTTDQIAPTTQRIGAASGSDHRAVIVTLSNKPGRVSRDRSAAITRSRADEPPAVSGVDATRRQQIANAQAIAQAAAAVGASGRAVYVALVAAVGESDLINVDYGDNAGPDSRGLFQQRSSWGPYADRMNPVTAAKMFFLGPHQGGQGGLLDLAGWESLPVTTAIHRVQINADPNHYTKFEARAREIGTQAGIDFDAPGTAVPGTAGLDPACPGAGAPSAGAPMAIGSGPCPLDELYARGHQPGADCNGALTFVQKQMQTGSTSWYRRCLALVMQAYGYAGGAATAFQAGQEAAAGGRLSTDRTRIPRGAVLYWDGRATGNPAGHVAIYDGDGYIYSNDVTGPGTVGRVPWDFPETNWGQKFMGWSPPYFPTGVGGRS